MTNLTQILVQLGALRKDGEVVTCRLDSLHADVRAIRKELGELQTSVTVLKGDKCPHPGKCDSIEETVATHSTSIRSLEDTRTAAKGGWKTLAVLMTLAAGLGGLIVWVFELVRNVQSVAPHFVPGP